MTARKMFKKRGRIVGVITNLRELRRAARMTDLPDFYEIRLDHLAKAAEQVEAEMSILRRPIIFTARHPAEGGANHLSANRRRNLLLRFLPKADCVDVELRSVTAMRPVLRQARRRHIPCIISYHDFGSSPPVRSLHTKAAAARDAGADLFKVAVRTDTQAHLVRLFDFVATADGDFPVSVMGMGKLGTKSRVVLAKSSVLVYAAIGTPKVKGQLSVAQLRRKIGRMG